MSKELSLDVAGIIEKHLSWDKYLGCDSQVAMKAFELYQERLAEGKDGTPDEDWQKAEDLVREEFAMEFLEKTAPRLA